MRLFSAEKSVVSPRFLVVDDHPLFLEALKLVIHGAYPAAFVAEAASLDAAREVLNSKDQFDVVLLDLSMPGTSGLDGVLELRARYPKLPIVIVSALEDPRIIHEVMSLGTAGFISKSTRGADLAQAIQDVLAGSVVLPVGYRPPQESGTGECSSDLNSRLILLTPQQVRVLQMLRHGMLNKQIAHELGVGETTVKAHVSEILRKLKVSSRTQAVIEVARIDFDSIVAQVHDDEGDRL